MGKIFSLCLTTSNINNKEKKFLYRIADKIGDELQEHKNNVSEDIDNNEQVSRNPYTSFNNHSLNELMIWEWDPNLNEWARKTNIPFYELINSIKITSLKSEENLIELLKKGYNIPNYHGQRSLVVTKEGVNNYSVIEIDSNIVTSVNGLAKLNEHVTKINGYILNKNDFINTQKVIVISDKGEKLPAREFYKYLELKQPNFIVEALTFEEKLRLFINKELKIRNITRSHQKEIKNLFTEIVTDYNQVQAFFEENGFKEDNLIFKVNQISNQISYILDEKNLWNDFSKAMVNSIPKLTEEFKKVAELEFLNENKKIVDNINAEIFEKEKLHKVLSEKCEKIKGNITVLENKKTKIEKTIMEKENMYKGLEEASIEKIDKIKGNMAEFISDIALLDQLGIRHSSTKPVGEGFSVRVSEKNNEEIEVLNDFNEFFDILTLNLKMAGIESNSSNYVSKFILGTLMQKTKLFLIGKYVDEIVNTISITISGRSAKIITVTNPDICLEEILEQIKNSLSNVVLIKNIFSLNESLGIQLLKENLEKTLIFGNDLSDSINFMPNSILNFCNFIFLDFIENTFMKNKFTYADASKINFQIEYDKYLYRDTLERLKKLKNICIFSKTHCSVKSELITFMGEGDDDGLYSWLMCEAIPHKILTNGLEEAQEILDSINLSQKYVNKLQEILW